VRALRVGTQPAAGPAVRVRRWRRHVLGYLFIAPWLIGFFVFFAGPMAVSAFLAFTNYDLLTPPRFIGLRNFERMAGDDLFYTTLYNTAYYTFLAVPLQVALALLLAVALNVKVRGVNLFRTAFYLPAITPTVASVILWIYIYNPDYGVANSVLRALGLEPIGWLWDPFWSKPALIVMSLWTIGTQMVVFLAGLQSVPEVLLEAAAIDGAGRLRRFWHVTVPMVSPVIFFNLVVGVIGSFQVFTAAFIATGGGPRNTTLFYVLFLYFQGFQDFRMGYASALAWVLFLIVLTLTLLQFWIARRWVYYEGPR
jgi:multiple sugar transport system permease protein